MIRVPDTEEMSDFNIADFCTPPLEKYIDRRGYIYIVHDSAFPEYIKVGRTSDCKKRLIGYNSDRPYNTCRMLYISDLFEDMNEIERRILAYMYDNTSPTTLTREWFEIKHKEKLIEIIEKVEKIESEKSVSKNEGDI